MAYLQEPLSKAVTVHTLQKLKAKGEKFALKPKAKFSPSGKSAPLPHLVTVFSSLDNPEPFFRGVDCPS